MSLWVLENDKFKNKLFSLVSNSIIFFFLTDPTIVLTHPQMIKIVMSFRNCDLHK